MIVSLLGLAIALKAVVHSTQQLRHFLMADLVFAVRQFIGQGAGAFAGPSQRRLRIAP